MHKEVSHKRLFHLDLQSGDVLAQTDFVSNVQKRLGNNILGGDIVCRLCGSHLDPQVDHAEICCTAEATRGHYAVVQALVQGIKLADPAVTTEPTGLTRSGRRPADILTSAAVPGKMAALDVCVASPIAAAAKGDAAESAFKRKLQKYKDDIPDLSRAGIIFRPLIWTADGRPHPAVVRTLRHAADIAVTRNGQQASASQLVSRWKHSIQIAILRRRAAMMRAVLPAQTVREQWLLAGQSRRECAAARLDPIDEEVDSENEGDGDEQQDEHAGQAGVGETSQLAAPVRTHTPGLAVPLVVPTGGQPAAAARDIRLQAAG